MVALSKQFPSGSGRNKCQIPFVSLLRLRFKGYVGSKPDQRDRQNKPLSSANQYYLLFMSTQFDRDIEDSINRKSFLWLLVQYLDYFFIRERFRNVLWNCYLILLFAAIIFVRKKSILTSKKYQLCRQFSLYLTLWCPQYHARYFN